MTVSQAEAARRRARALVSKPPRKLVEVPSVLETIIKDEEHKADEKKAETTPDLSKQTAPERKPEETATAIIATPVNEKATTPVVPTNKPVVDSLRPSNVLAGKHDGLPLGYSSPSLDMKEKEEIIQSPVRALHTEVTQNRILRYPLPKIDSQKDQKTEESPRVLLKKDEKTGPIKPSIPSTKVEATTKKAELPNRALLKEDVESAFMNVPFTSGINTRTINYAPIGFEEERFLSLSEPTQKTEQIVKPTLQKSLEKIPEKAAVDAPKIDAIAENFFDVYPKPVVQKAPVDKTKRDSKKLAQAKAKFEVDKLAGHVFDNKADQSAKDADKKTESIVIQRTLHESPFKQWLRESESNGFALTRVEFGTPEKDKNILI